MPRKKVVILGATGSVGRSALEVCRHEGFEVAGVSANTDAAGLWALMREYRVPHAALSDGAGAELLRALAGDRARVLAGEAGLMELAGLAGADVVLNAIVGIAGLRPTLAAIEAGHDVALANKETLVAGGEIVMRQAREKGVKILPVDSEHSAVFQCLQGQARKLKKVILTASGGPFFGFSAGDLRGVTREQALKHPNWEMGPKITVDSATMMNKGLELIEAVHLFGVSPGQVDIVVHRQSIVHSLVCFEDNSLLAQLGAPDMRLPIQYALCYPNGSAAAVDRLDLTRCGDLTFAPCDEETFILVSLARRAIETGGTAPAVLNGANERAVAAFLDGSISFVRIGELVEAACAAVPVVQNPNLSDIFDADCAARNAVDRFLGE